MIDLRDGNPWGKDEAGKPTPASYSRFLLPFSYKLQKKNIDNLTDRYQKLHFKSIPASRFDSARVRYFTSETANVLYKRAIWAKIPEEIWESTPERCGPFFFKARKSNSASQINIAPPLIVLFEGKQPDTEPYELLQHGFLIVEAYLNGDNSPSFDDFLEFNDLFRYVDSPYQEHLAIFYEAMADFPADFRSCKKIEECGYELSSFIYNNRWLSLLEIPLLINGNLYDLTKNGILNREKIHALSDHLCCDSDKCLIYADNRAFVWTCAILENGAYTIQKRYNQDVSDFWKFGHWLRLLNVDPPLDTPNKTQANIKKFEQEWLKEKTYKRWVEDGTFYGYCYHSGAMLGPPIQDPPLWSHFGQMYFDQIILLFYLRITLFAFSRNLTHINENDEKQLASNFRKLRRSFAKFTNLYQFPLISNQQQGVEMYDIARKSMDIDDLFRDVRDEVTSTHEFLEMKAAIKLAGRADFIATWGIPLAVMALVTSIFGLPQDLFDSVKGCWFKCPPDWSFLSQCLVIALSGGGAFYITKKILQKKVFDN